MKRYFFLLLCLFTCGFAQEKNAIHVCDNGLEMFAWDLEFIRHAEHSIDVAACFFGGEIAREMLGEIEKRLAVCPDLKAHILTTPILFEQADYDLVDRLRRTYPDRFHLEHAVNVTIVWPDVTGIDNHVKMCVVDEWYFSMGGTNLEDGQCTDGTYTPERHHHRKLNSVAKQLPAGMRDQDIVGRGPIASEMRQTFYKLFSIWHHHNQTGTLIRDPEHFADNSYYFDVPSHPHIAAFEDKPLIDASLRYILSGAHQEKNAITEEYVRLINSAEHEIKIANLYLNPQGPILPALLDAVNRGVKLTVITNGIRDLPEASQYFGWGNRLTYVPLFYGKKFSHFRYPAARRATPKNTRIFEYNVDDVFLHKKMMTIDDHTFLVGSYNLGLKSHIGDYETIMVIESKEAVAAVNAVFAKDLAHSKEVTTDEALGWYFNPLTAHLGALQQRLHGLL